MEDEDVEDDYDIRDDQPDNFIDEGGQINLANDEAESDAIVAQRRDHYNAEEEIISEDQDG